MRPEETRKRVLILAGQNGAGKTTFAHDFLIPEAHCPTFLNADVIAADLVDDRVLYDNSRTSQSC